MTEDYLYDKAEQKHQKNIITIPANEMVFITDLATINYHFIT